MHDAPSTAEMIAAVKSFLDKTAQPALSGHAAFHARVASNVLDIVLREIEQRSDAESAERERLVTLLGTTTNETVETLNRRLCDMLRSGELDLSTPGLLSHLKTTTIAQLSVDQPGYSGLKGR